MCRHGYCHSSFLAVQDVDAGQSIILYTSSDDVHLLMLVFLLVSHLLPPCPALFLIIMAIMSIPVESILHQMCCYRRNCCRFPDIFISCVVSETNTLYPQLHSHIRLQPLILLFHYPAFIPICHSRFFNSLIDVMLWLDGYFLVIDDSGYLSPFIDFPSLVAMFFVNSLKKIYDS